MHLEYLRAQIAQAQGNTKQAQTFSYPSSFRAKKLGAQVDEQRLQHFSTQPEVTMIIDILDNLSVTTGTHIGFLKAFQFLEEAVQKPFTPGRHELWGDRLIAIVEEGVGKTREKSRLENHKRYIDIQYVVEGVEENGWKAYSDCKVISQPIVRSVTSSFSRIVPTRGSHFLNTRSRSSFLKKCTCAIGWKLRSPRKSS